MKRTKAEWLQTLKNLMLVVVGTIVLSCGTAIFLLPYELIAGGVPGLAVIFYHILPWDFLTVDVIVTILTWLFFGLGFLVMGKAFAAKTLVSAIVYPVGVSFFTRLLDSAVFGGFLDLSTSAYSDIAVILAALFGGLFVGTGCAVTFLGGGSTGGVDILGLILCKIFRRLKKSVAFFIVDATTVVLGMFVLQDLVVSLLGIISAFLAAIMVDKVVLGRDGAFIAHIVTDRYEAINEAVIKRMNRTTTILDATGGYSGEEKKLVVVSFTIRQYSELLALVSAEDKDAFVTVHRAHEINGEGWTR